MLKRTKHLATSGIIAGLYVILSLLTLPVLSGAIQFRLSEGLCLLPLLFPESILGVFVGCIIANLLSACAILDIILGSLITLISALLTYFFGKIIKKEPLKIFVGGLFPVLLNAIFLPIIWQISYGFTEYIYPLQALFLLISQSASVYLVGSIMYTQTKKLKKL